MTLWVEVGDLMDFASRHERPSGIQRVGFELALALARTVPPPYRVAFCSTATGRDTWPTEVSLGEISATYSALTSACPAAYADTGSSLAHPQEGQRPAARIVPGDVLLALSPPAWSWEFAGRVNSLVQGGVRFAMFLHDIIPILHPSWCESRVTAQFEPWHRAMLPCVDTLITSSKAVATDLVDWATGASVPIRRPVTVVRLGSRFDPSEGPLALELPPGVEASQEPGFALFVSTVEPRKNHALALEVWQRAIDALGPSRVPQLVCVGRVGWLVDDLLQRLSDVAYLGGKVVLLKGVPDWQLAQLYSSCRFTFFPSHYEGWGLPVTESLAFGKLCLASNRGGIPEAGGAYCVYFDPGSADEAEAAVRGVIESASLLHQLTARVRAGFQEVTWSATAREVLAAVLSPVGPHRAS